MDRSGRFASTRAPARLVLAIALASLAACSSDNDDPPLIEEPPPSVEPPPAEEPPPPVATIADKCAAGYLLLPADMSLLTSEVVPATADAPEHCHLVARFGERVGANEQTYATRMRLRLPADASWNGRFHFEGGGGTDGNLGNATGATMAGDISALARGFAVVSTDAGHDNAVNNDPDRGGTATFGLDPQARLDYGYNALDEVTRRAKAVLETFYGQAPEYSYFVGCSNGGRQAMMASQRFPEHFDGIVAGNPGFNLPRAGIAEAWDSQQFASAAKAIDSSQVDPIGHPLIRFGFSPSDLQLVADDILAVCDGDDGVVDGIVGDFDRCDYDPAIRLPVMQCTAGKQDDCLLPAQVLALRNVMSGPRNSAGQPLYSDWPWDPGIAAGGWRVWKLETAPNAPVNNAINLTLGAAALPYVFTTPPTITTDLVGYMLSFDMDNDAPKIEVTSGEYTTPAMQFMAANSTDLSAFRARGAKMIVYHGLADPVFSFNDTRNWYDGVVAASGGSNAGLANARSFVRLFPVPGMNHCSGGPATDRFDALTAVVDWVEQGVAPDSILASANPASGFAGRTRPLCPYPQVARYDGSGDIEQASSFVCR